MVSVIYMVTYIYTDINVDIDYNIYHISVNHQAHLNAHRISCIIADELQTDELRPLDLFVFMLLL